MNFAADLLLPSGKCHQKLLHILKGSHLSFMTGLADRFEEYPKLRELIRLKVRLYNATCLLTD